MSSTGSGRHVHLASAHSNRITTPTHTTPRAWVIHSNPQPYPQAPPQMCMPLETVYRYLGYARLGRPPVRKTD